MLVESQPTVCGTSQNVPFVFWYPPRFSPAQQHTPVPERLMEHARCVDAPMPEPRLRSVWEIPLWVLAGG